MEPLAVFLESQLARIRRELISAAPKQTFTAGPRVEVFHRTPAHRMSYSHRVTQPTKAYTQHGTQECFAQCGCRCPHCSNANGAYRRRLRRQAAALPSAEVL